MNDEKIYKYGFYSALACLILVIVLVGNVGDEYRTLKYEKKMAVREHCEKAGGIIFQDRCVDKAVFIEVGK